MIGILVGSTAIRKPVDMPRRYIDTLLGASEPKMGPVQLSTFGPSVAAFQLEREIAPNFNRAAVDSNAGCVEARPITKADAQRDLIGIERNTTPNPPDMEEYLTSATHGVDTVDT